MQRIFKFAKSKVPKISPTELTALRSGNTSLDRQILQGKAKLPRLTKLPYRVPFGMLDDLFEKWDNSPVYPNKDNNKWVQYLAKNKFFSFLISEKYGGIKLSVSELSDILTKIASVDPALGVATMVPNSLGPGELIGLYGTDEQKEYFLPKLANGDFIPCFGLTGPNNGSDATGSIDTGIVVEKDGKKMIQLTLNKRYITLAPVANLMGIAFNLEDPQNLLGKTGVSLALVKREHEGLIQETHHNPMNAGFPNGTIKGTIYIELDQIIGGSDNIGEGWKMLMECLSAGRGVSLPATANASSKVAAFGMYHYIQIRDQFRMPLSKMEAIQEKMNNIFYHTWVIQSSVALTNTILDDGNSPAVLSAIMKQQTTERGRIVLNEALDIHGGAGICLGYSNMLEKFYRSAPIGITVEGSNTLTRSLIIFGQGLNKSHPHIFSILDSILQDNSKDFQKELNEMIRHSVGLYLKTFCLSSSLEKQIVDYAALTNFIALKGGALKREQMLSGDMADIFSNLYLALSVQFYEKSYPSSKKLSNYVIRRLMNENQVKINKVIDNLGIEKYALLHLKGNVNTITYDEEREIFHEIMNNKMINNEIKKNIHVKNNILEDMENALSLDPNCDSYHVLKSQIINVGEFKNE